MRREEKKMAHNLLCSSSNFVQIGVNRFRIKFCIGKWNLFLSNVWVWYPGKQPNLKKWIEIEKNDLCDQKAQDRKWWDQSLCIF